MIEKRGPSARRKSPRLARAPKVPDGLRQLISTYVCAVSAGVSLATWFASSGAWMQAVALFGAAVVVVFASSVLNDNSSMMDLYWSILPAALVIMLLASRWEATSPLNITAGVLVVTQSARLASGWWRQWRGPAHEDWHYEDLRPGAGRLYWPLSFVAVHLLSALMVGLASLSIVVLATTTTPVALPLVIVSVVIVMLGIALEAIADGQLWRFRSTPHDPQDILRTGLWKYARHPNYFGELLYWWGLTLLALLAGGAWWLLAGPVAVTLLITLVTAPMMDARLAQRKSRYTATVGHLPMLIPLPRLTPAEMSGGASRRSR